MEVYRIKVLVNKFSSGLRQWSSPDMRWFHPRLESLFPSYYEKLPMVGELVATVVGAAVAASVAASAAAAHAVVVVRLRTEAAAAAGRRRWLAALPSHSSFPKIYTLITSEKQKKAQWKGRCSQFIIKGKKSMQCSSSKFNSTGVVCLRIFFVLFCPGICTTMKANLSCYLEKVARSIA